MSKPTHELAVIIVSWNVRELLRGCLESLCAEARRSELSSEVWVIDNASEDASADMVASEFGWVNLVRSTVNLGYVKANNLVLKQVLEVSPPRYVWLLNPDTLIEPGCILALTHFLAARSDAGIIGPMLLNPNRTLQESAFRFPGLTQMMFELGLLPQRFYRSRLNGRYAERLYRRHKPFAIDHPLGAAMMSRTDAIEQIGLLDERFFMYCEEIDWAWRMRKQGWSSWLVPQAVVTHFGGASTGQAKPHSMAHLWISRAHLYRKHRSRWEYVLARALVRHRFGNALKEPEPWASAYRRIIEAWSL